MEFLVRSRVKQITSLDERLADQLRQITEKLNNLPPGPERTETLKNAEKLRRAAEMYNYLFSGELQPPK